MSDSRVYSERYVSIMWVRNPIMMVEKAHCYPCCDVPTNKKCTGCEYPAPCLLRRKHGRVYPSRVQVVSVGSRRADDLYLSMLYGMVGAGIADMSLPYQRRYIDSVMPRIKRRSKKTCLLPGCQNSTTHRGGYCCSVHCRQHQVQMGKRIKAIGR